MRNMLLIAICILPAIGLCQEAPPQEAIQLISMRVQIFGLAAGVSIPDELADPVAFLKDATASKQITWSRDYRGASISGGELKMSSGESLPVITGVNISQFGGRTPTTSYRETGTTVRIKPDTIDEKRILLSVELECSRMEEMNIDTDQESGSIIPQTITKSLTYQSQIIVEDSRPKVAMVSSTRSNDVHQESERTLILITASIESH